MAKILHESSYIFRFTSRINMYEEHTFTFPAKTDLLAQVQHSWSLKCYNLAGEWTGSGTSSVGGGFFPIPNWPSFEYTDPSFTFTLPFSEVIDVRTFLHLKLRFGELHIETISETSTSLRIKYWVTCEQAGILGWYEGLEWRGSLSCVTENSPEETDSKPTGLLCEGSNEPLAVTNPRPAFSAIFQDLIGQSASALIELEEQQDDIRLSVWTPAPFPRVVRDGERCQNIVYSGGYALNMDNRDYYWRIRFIDQASVTSDQSDWAHFRTYSEAPPPPLPPLPPPTPPLPPPTSNAPTELLCEGEPSPMAVRDAEPEFSAINNFTHATTHYQIIISKKLAENTSLPAEPYVWNSDWLADSTSINQRCSDKESGGDDFAFDAITYYWAIRFIGKGPNWEDFPETSDWSYAATFRMSGTTPPPVFEVVQTFSDILYSIPKHVFEHEEIVWIQATDLITAGAGPLTLTVTADSGDQISVALTEGPATRYRSFFIITAGATSDPFNRIHLDLNEKATLSCDVNGDGTAATEDVYCHGMIGPTGSFYHIQVNTQQDMLGTMMWDSGNLWSSTILTDEVRSPDFEYGGATLDLTGKVYYWRIKLWNVGDSEGPWSIEEAYFSGYPAGEVPRPPPNWVTAQYREPKGTAEVGLVAAEETYTDLADVIALSISSNKNPLDNIETGQGTIYLSNIDRLFYSEFETSDFYRKLAGKKIRISLGAVVESADDLYTKMTGIVKSVNVNRLQKTAEIVALEFLDYYRTRRIKQTPVYKNITVFDLFCNLVRYCFPNWRNQHEIADWDYFVDPLGFRRAYIYLGVGDGTAEYLIQDHNKDPIEPVYNIIPDTDAIYKNGIRLFFGTDYMIAQENRPLGVVSTLQFLKDYPTSDDILYGCFTIETIVAVVQYKDTFLIEELEKIAEVSDCRIYADEEGKLVCKSNRVRDAVDTIGHDTHLINLSSRRDTDEIINHVVVESKPYQIAGERKTLDDVDVSFGTIPKSEVGIEHTFYFDEYTSELVFDLTWSIQSQSLFGIYTGSGSKEDFTFPLALEIEVWGGLFGRTHAYGKIHIQTLEVDSLHIALKFWVECYVPASWYTSPFDFSATLTAKGITIGQPITYVGEAIDEASFHDMWIGEKRKTFTFEYLEPGIDIAQQAAESLLSIFHKLPTYYDCEVRGMPHLRLLDTVEITEPTANLFETEMQVIKLVDNLRVGDYKTNVGLMLKEVPIIKAPAYWTPEWQEIEIYSEDTEEGSMEWIFNSRIIGYSFKLEWTIEFNSPYFPPSLENSGANYNMGELPFEMTFQGEVNIPMFFAEGELVDFGTLEISLNVATDTSVKIDYKFTLAENWTWEFFEVPLFLLPPWLYVVAPRLTIRIACIPEFSYETVGPMALPHYASTNDYTPPSEQPSTGYYYEPEYFPRILYNGAQAHAQSAAAIGINVFLYTNFHRFTWAQRESFLVTLAQHGMRLIPGYERIGNSDDPNIDPAKGAEENFWDEKATFIQRYRDDDRIYGWNTIQEPEYEDVDVVYIRRLYESIKTYDPDPGKPCLLLWGQSRDLAYKCQTGEYDLWAARNWDSGSHWTSQEVFKNGLESLDQSYHWRIIGKDAIAYFFEFDALERHFEIWQEFCGAGQYNLEVAGTMYYNAARIMADTDEGEATRAKIKAFHKAIIVNPMRRSGQWII